jgi:hypothetical protein
MYDDADIIDMDQLAQVITDMGLVASVEQTGGGCATLYVGPEDENGYCLAAAGAGWFAHPGPGYRDPQASWFDFCWGADDDGESDPVRETTARDINDLARDIYTFAKSVEASRV